MTKGKGLAARVAQAADLAERAGPSKQESTLAVVPAGTLADAQARQPQASRAGKKGLTVYISPEMRKALRRLAIDLDKTVEAIVIEAISAELLKRSQ